MAKKKETKDDSSSKGCCGFLSIRVKAYVLLLVCVIIGAGIIFSCYSIPLSTMRSLEAKQVEIDMLTMDSDIMTDLITFKDLAYASLKDLSSKIIDLGGFTNRSAVSALIDNFFQKNGKWNEETYKNGYALHFANRTVFKSQFYEMRSDIFVLNTNPVPLPPKFEGNTPASQEFLKRILKNEPWVGIADMNQTTRGYYPFYLVVSVPWIMDGRAAAWLTLFQDHRTCMTKNIRKLKCCAASVPGNAVLIPQQLPVDFVKYARGLEGRRIGYFSTMEESGGTYKMLIHKKGMVRGGFTACAGEKPIHESDGYFGTTYFSVADMSTNDLNQITFYVRIDHELDIMTGTMDFILKIVITPSLAFLVLIVIVIVIYVEVGVMHQLDVAKKSLHKIVLERRAILEEYLKDDKNTRDYYSVSRSKEKNDEELNALLEQIASDTGGSGDELGLLLNMSSSIGAWMDHILQDKLRRLDSVRKENDYYLEALKLLSAWSRRSDVRFSPSYIAVDGGFDKSFELKSKFDLFSKVLNLSHILGNGIALEMFKSYCKASGHEGSLSFVLDIAWLTMMEEALRSAGGNVDSSMTDTSGSVSSAHGNVSHSQIVRLVQTIFSTYIFSTEHVVTPIGLSPAALKRLAVRADPKGKVKYAPGIFKSAASDVRRFLESEVIPAFKETAQFRALFLMLNLTSQLGLTTTGNKEITIYACPFVQPESKSGEHKKGEDEDEDEDEDEAISKRSVDHYVLRLPLSTFDSDTLADLVEEEKSYQKKNVDASISRLPSVGDGGSVSSSKRSLPSAESPSSSRAKLRAISPFAALLPGAKRKASSADGANEEEEASSEGKKDSEWMKKSFALTSKKGEKGGDSEEEGDSQDEQ